MPVDGEHMGRTCFGTLVKMGIPAPVPRQLAGAPFLGSAAVAAGLVTRKRLLGPSFRRVLHGVYISRGVVVDHGVKCRAAALLLPQTHAISGVSAAWCYGVRLATTSHPVIVSTTGTVHVEGARGVLVHQTPLDPVDVMLRDGLRLTTPIRAAWDIATLEPPDDVVPFIDAMIREGLLTANELRTRVALSGRLWRVTRVRQAVDLVDGRSESPPESRIRVAVIRAGLPRPVPQFDVRVDGTFIARVDLAWPDAKVAVEYDGSHHADVLQMRRDRRRLNSLVHAGWTVIHATAADLADPSTLLDQIRAALRRTAA